MSDNNINEYNSDNRNPNFHINFSLDEIDGDDDFEIYAMKAESKHKSELNEYEWTSKLSIPSVLMNSSTVVKLLIILHIRID
jgi:hypothetical protein